MKKLLCVTLCVMFVFGLCACGGKISNLNTPDVDSAMYSQKDITAAINVIKREFLINWSGCTLTDIYYAGDEKTKEHQDWADRYSADEVIVLLSTFDVDDSGGDGSLNPNSTYTNWMWILVRTNNGQWKHVDHGY